MTTPPDPAPGSTRADAPERLRRRNRLMLLGLFAIRAPRTPREESRAAA